MSRTIEATVKFTIAERCHQIFPVEAFEEATDEEVAKDLKQFFNWTHIKDFKVLNLKDIPNPEVRCLADDMGKRNEGAARPVDLGPAIPQTPQEVVGPERCKCGRGFYGGLCHGCYMSESWCKCRRIDESLVQSIFGKSHGTVIGKVE